MLRALTAAVLLANSIIGARGAPTRSPSLPTSVMIPPVVPGRDTALADSVNLFGYYYVADPVPEWCSDIDHLHLSTIDVEFPVEFPGGDSTKPRLKSVPLWGFIRLKADSGVRPIDFRLKDIRLQGQAFSFGTQQVDSVSYDFSGRFLKLGDFPHDPPNGVVLVGHFRKLRKGRVLYEADVSIRYFAGD